MTTDGGGGAGRALGLSAIRATLAAHEPQLNGARLSRRRAATALILHEPDTGPPEILFMLRSTRPGDRWSGHVALPGGRYEEGDPDLAATAARETREEVGIDLPDPFGRLDDQGSRVAPIIVSTFLYAVDERPAIVPDPREVEDTVWVPVPALLHPDNAVHHHLGRIGRFPALRYEDFTVWGLTLRTLETFFGLLGRDLPRP